MRKGLTNYLTHPPPTSATHSMDGNSEVPDEKSIQPRSNSWSTAKSTLGPWTSDFKATCFPTITGLVSPNGPHLLSGKDVGLEVRQVGLTCQLQLLLAV